jgi:hypothetical protein
VTLVTEEDMVDGDMWWSLEVELGWDVRGGFIDGSLGTREL